jgi:branched-chain amino acid transport system ATP-binding protein
MTQRLEVDNLSSGYGQLQVLNGVSLAVPSESVVALLGPNGAGKTTLLRSLAGLEPPWTGRIAFDGHEVNHLSTSDRARIGICLVPAGRAIFRSLTVSENIAMHAQSRRHVKEAIERACTAFPVLRRHLNQVAGTLSGGEQQMLALSRALIRQAPLVLADELSLGLAPVVVDEIINALVALRSQGSSVLVVEQYVERVLAVADYAYVLHRGNVVLQGTPQDVLKSDVFEAYLGAATA